MKGLNSILVFFISVMLSGVSYAQLSEGGTPISFNKKGLEANIPVIHLPAFDVEAMLAEDEINQVEKIGPYRFGKEIPVYVTLENAGTWETLKDGSKLWRQSIHSAGAYSINLIFENFQLTDGSKLFIYNQDHSAVLGAFTQKNNKAHGYFATDLINGDFITLEYFEPANTNASGHFNLTTVVHAYKNVVSNPNSHNTAASGACNINVNCPLGIGWENERNSVTRVVLGGGFCTGAFVNNTANDGTPYYLTANHCYQGTNPATWVFQFNYQATNCNGSNGSLNQSLTGSSLKANNGGSDFALVELDDPIPANYNPYLAGWRNDNNASSSSICIHHPEGDIKKISRDQNPTTTATFGGATTWRIGQWEEGTTEPGSSGSPLFDEATHQIIGQLYGGSAACNGSNPNNESDYYGKFSTSWNGSSSSNRLRDWLDPGNTGVTSLSGFDPNAPAYALDAQALTINEPADGATFCDSVITPVVTIKNGGSAILTSLTITLSIDGNDYVENWTGSLNTNQIEPVTFPTINLSYGSHSATVILSNPNSGTDENLVNDTTSIAFTLSEGREITLVLVTDSWGNETSWDIKDSDGNVLTSVGIDTYEGNTTYNTVFCIPSDDCYTFTIYDDYGDGICCGEGQGSYTLKDENGTTIATGGQFQDQETVSLGLEINMSSTIETNNQNNGTATATVTYGTSPFTYSWSPGGDTTQTITGLSSGTYTVTVTDANGCTTSGQVVVNNNVGIDETELAKLVEVFPNPTKGIVNIKVPALAEGVGVTVHNLVGEVVFAEENLINNNLTIDMAGMSNGLYYISVRINGVITTKKLILTR